MVRRGSTVRVRQRTSAFSLLSPSFSFSGVTPTGCFGVNRAPAEVHGAFASWRLDRVVASVGARWEW